MNHSNFPSAACRAANLASVSGMTGRLAAFDDWLDDVLVERAAAAGEDVETYVARAVASRMVADHVPDGGTSAEELIAHLSKPGGLVGSGMPDVTAVVADPERLHALHATGLLDSPPEEVYDRITRAAAAALDAPSAAISLVDVDRQFFKSKFGMGGNSPQERQTPLDQSVCQYTAANAAPLILEDAPNDPVFKNHPAVAAGGVVAYLGVPLINQGGQAIGALCVFDQKPRLWSTGHVQILTDLAELAAERIFASERSAEQ